MNPSPAMRIVDVNFNRLAEGLRVLEEVARLVMDDAELTSRLKTLRHNLIRADLAFNLSLLDSRDSAEDVGAALEVNGESPQKELPLVAIANFRRVQESLRVLEETAKLPELAGAHAPGLDSRQFRNARFEIYTIEQQLMSRLVRREKAGRISGLYVIIDTQALQGRDLMLAAQQVIQAGVKIVQLRDKTLSKKLLVPLAEKLRRLCKQNDVLFIINDYLDVALAVEADGLHLGQDDLPFNTARKLLPAGTLLGCSVLTVDQAFEAESAGADYLAVGAIFPTASKEDIGVVGLNTLKQVKKSARTPVVAIGGINRENAGQVIKAGADSLCVISAVLNAPDIALAAGEIIKIIKGTHE